MSSNPIPIPYASIPEARPVSAGVVRMIYAGLLAGIASCVLHKLASGTYHHPQCDKLLSGQVSNPDLIATAFWNFSDSLGRIPAIMVQLLPIVIALPTFLALVFHRLRNGRNGKDDRKLLLGTLSFALAVLCLLSPFVRWQEVCTLRI